SEEELILRHYRKPQPGESGMFVTATDILERINVGVKMVMNLIRFDGSLRVDEVDEVFSNFIYFRARTYYV
ncbi:MAG: DUF3874 domain-containing protein, partial [Prevotellaceae bacterium]|nr:DUF3874 domain-containing protein [Prevotellaceae bacterium]